MKRPRPDLELAARSRFTSLMKTSRKIKRLWGTTTVDGIEVLNLRQFYHPESEQSENYEKLFKFLGIYSDISGASTEGLDEAWVYFNRNKLTTTNVVVSPFVQDNLNKIKGDGNNDSTLKTKIAIGTLRNDFSKYKEPYILDRNDTESELISVIKDNYEDLWDTCMIEQVGYSTVNKTISEQDVEGNTTLRKSKDYLPASDPWVAALALNCLRDSELGVEITKVRKELVALPRPIFTNSKQGREEDRYYKTRYRVSYVVDLTIPLKQYTQPSVTASNITNLITDDYSSYSPRVNGGGKSAYEVSVAKPNGMVLKSLIQQDIQVSDESEEPVPVVLTNRDYEEWNELANPIEDVADNIWYKKGDTYYLRAEAVQSPTKYGLKFSELNKLLGDVLDTGYKKKSVPWYKKALAIVVFIIVVVITRNAGGASWAMAIVVGSLALTLISIALTELGESEWASAFAEANRTVEPLVMVANVYLVVTGLGAAYDKAVESAALEAGVSTSEVTFGQAMAQVGGVGADGIISSIVEGAKDIAAGNITSNASIQFTTKMLKVNNYLQQRRLERISDRNRDLASEYEDLMKEMNQERDTLKGFAKVYSRPATADWSIYAETYDLPYEAGGGPLALGNVQRTTKQAIRKSSYDDWIFDEIRIM